MPTSLLAYDAAGNVIATLDHMVAQDAARNVVGLVDFEAHELAGGSLTDIWIVSGAVGSGTWPEWLGAGAHDFTVDLDPGFGPPGFVPGRHRIGALVHKTSGFRRERAAVMAEIAARTAAATERTPEGRPIVDLRDLLGSPTRPLRIGPAGRTLPPIAVPPSNLPILVVS